MDERRGTELETSPRDFDSRESRELSAGESADLCRGCVLCCTYITIEVDAPRAAWEYDQWIWALHHRGIALVVERPERWFIHVETVCEQLGPEGRCGIHGRHPVLCRDYDPRSCERRLPLASVRARFDDAADLERWLEATRPAHWRRLIAYRAAAARRGMDAAPPPAFIPLPALWKGSKSPTPAGTGTTVNAMAGTARGRRRL